LQPQRRDRPASLPDGPAGGEPRAVPGTPVRGEGPRPAHRHQVGADGGPRRDRGRGHRPARAPAVRGRRRRHNRPVPPAVAREPPGRRIHRPARLRALPRGRRGARLPAGLLGAVCPLLLSRRGDRGRRRRLPSMTRWRTPAAAIVSGLLFATAFAPYRGTGPLLLPLLPSLPPPSVRGTPPRG